MDPAAREELMADLKKTDPARWPMVIQEFRAAAAYRRRAEARAASESRESRVESPELDRSTLSPQLSALNSQPSTPRSVLQAPCSDRHDELALAPLPELSVVAIGDNHLALAPEPPISGGITAPKDPVAAEKAGEAIATPPEPPSLAARLAATREGSTEQGAGSSEGSRVERRESRGVQTLNTQLSTLNSQPSTQADWQGHLTAAIHSIESQSAAGSKNESDVALQARLRMLYLLAGRRDDAMRPLPAAPKPTQDYWTSQIYGLSTWMDSERTPDPARRAAETKRILSEALNQLGDAAPLAVRNLTFCTEVHYFGSFDAVKSAEFSPGQKVLLYAEVENFHTEPSPKGFHTAVKFNWQVFDSQGSRLGDYVSTTNEDTSLTPKHEIFLTKWFYLPSPMTPGRYKLQFTVEDVLGHKVGQSSIEFTIK